MSNICKNCLDKTKNNEHYCENCNQTNWVDATKVCLFIQEVSEWDCWLTDKGKICISNRWNKCYRYFKHSYQALKYLKLTKEYSKYVKEQQNI